MSSNGKNFSMEEITIAALLHDIGKFILIPKIPS